MSKSTISPAAAKFAAKTTTGAWDEARKAERMGRGIPFPIGATGTAVVASVSLTERSNRAGVPAPFGRVEIRVETPEEQRGTTFSGQGLTQDIRDPQNPDSEWSAERAWGSWLGLLESLGCPEEITKGYSDYQEVHDWFDEKPRKVGFEIRANPYTDRNGNEVVGKQIQAYAVGGTAVKTADAPPTNTETQPEHIGTCKHRGGPHLVLKDNGDTLDLYGVNSGQERPGIEKDSVESLVIF